MEKTLNPYEAQLTLNFGGKVNVTTLSGATFPVRRVDACVSPGTYRVQYQSKGGMCDDFIGHANCFIFTKGE